MGDIDDSIRGEIHRRVGAVNKAGRAAVIANAKRAIAEEEQRLWDDVFFDMDAKLNMLVNLCQNAFGKGEGIVDE